MSAKTYKFVPKKAGAKYTGKTFKLVPKIGKPDKKKPYKGVRRLYA